MKAFTDEVHFLNLGRYSKRVELVKNLLCKDMGAHVSKEEKEWALPQPPALEDIPITIRLMILDDVVADIDLENVQIASDFGKELFDYVVKARGNWTQITAVRFCFH